MSRQQSLDIFIVRLARKIAVLYSNNCANEEDYIQAGYLKLTEIHGDKYRKRNFRAYAITAISRAMREAALEAMCAASAPRRIKKQVHKIEILLAAGKTEHEICQKLKITKKTFINLKSLISAESWHRLFEEPTCDSEPFSVLSDLLSSCHLMDEDRDFIQAQLDNTINDLCLNRNQQYKKIRDIRSKLIRSGYDTTTN